MELIYKHSEGSVKPELIEITKTTVWLRKDIVEEKRTYTVDDVEITAPYYTYKEAKLSHEDFNIYSSELAAMNAVRGVNDSNNINRIIQNGVDNGDNQLIIMEAMADLYNLILDKM